MASTDYIQFTMLNLLLAYAYKLSFGRPEVGICQLLWDYRHLLLRGNSVYSIEGCGPSAGRLDLYRTVSIGQRGQVG